MGPLGRGFHTILTTYEHAYANDRYSQRHPVFVALAELRQQIQQAEPVAAYRPALRVKASMGVGRWAQIPWLALLDSHAASSVSDGTYLVYLFRADMRGVYLTISQGAKQLVSRHNETAILARTKILRSRLSHLSGDGFRVDDGLDLASTRYIARSYEAVTVAHKFYERNALPPDKDMVRDLARLLDVYRTSIARRS